MKPDWKGVWVAPVTPFRGGAVDRAAIGRIVEHCLAGGVRGLCPAGTTGEGASLGDAEFAEVVGAFLESVDGRVPVVPGTGSQSTERTIARTRLARELGADGALVVTPYYVKPPQEGLVRHYGEVASKAGFPIMLYNVPGRTCVNMLPETVERVMGVADVVAVKECAPLPQVAELIRRVGGKISILSGEDGTFLPFLSVGGDGIVSVAANLVPDKVVRVYDAFIRGETGHAREVFSDLGPLIAELFCETNPIPVKSALEWMGLISAEMRSPLVPMSRDKFEKLRSVLETRVRRGV